MGTTNITKFAGGATAQVQSDAGYTAQNGPATVGFVDGPADPTQVNKAFRQSSAVAAAVARLATDPAMGNQASFNDSEDTATLALKIKATLTTIPEFNTALKYVDLWRFLLENPATNDLAAKFTKDIIDKSSEVDRRILSEFNGDLFRTILTPKGILTNPPIADFAWLPKRPTDWSVYTNTPRYLQQADYRRLSNGMVEVRVGFSKRFATKVLSRGVMAFGSVPDELRPSQEVSTPIIGAIRGGKTSFRPFEVALYVDPDGKVYSALTDSNIDSDYWSIPAGTGVWYPLLSDETNTVPYPHVMVSLVYMPAFPKPYTGWKP